MLRTSSLALLNATGYFKLSVLKEPPVAQLRRGGTGEPPPESCEQQWEVSAELAVLLKSTCRIHCWVHFFSLSPPSSECVSAVQV